MKVLFVVTAYPRDEDDIITPWMGETITRLKSAGTQVEVLAPAYRGSPSGIIGGVMVHRFRYAPAALETLTHDMPALDRIRRNAGFLTLLPSYVAAGSMAARRIAREGDFDVAHAFWPIPHGLFALAAKRASRAALVSTFFSAELNWQGATRSVLSPVLSRIVAESDAVTVISSYTGQKLQELVPGVASVIIPFGAVAAGHHETGSVARQREPNDSFGLLFVGRLVHRKGIDVLLRAAAILEADRRLHIRVVGDGPERESLIGQATRLGLEQKVTFEGMIDSEVIQRRFRECDALVLPAIVAEGGDTEGLGVVLIEAMGYGKPVIASAAGGILDIVSHDDTGILVPPGDASALASAIERAMNKPAELAGIAARGKVSAAREFGWDSIVARLGAVYERAVENRLARSSGSQELSRTQ